MLSDLKPKTRKIEKMKTTLTAYLRSLVAQCSVGTFDRSTSLPCDALAARELGNLVGVPFVSAATISVYSSPSEATYYRIPIIRGETPAQHALRRALCALLPECRDTFRERISGRSARAATRLVSGFPLGSLRQRLMRQDLTPRAYKYERAVGLEFETVSKIHPETLADALPLWTRVTSDGSIERTSANPHANEVRALLTRSELEPRLFRLCEKFKSLGLTVNRSCGLHVHFDMRGRRADEVAKIAKRADKWLRALQELVPASRRENRYCRFGVSTRDRYHAVNLCSFPKFQTLEIRLHSGTVDYSKTLAWIRLCELILALKSGPRSGDCLGTLSQLPLAEHDLAYWRTRHAQLNPHLYSETARTSTESE